MKFSEIIDQASALLQDSGRITYRALKREFDLDDDALEDLKAELIKARSDFALDDQDSDMRPEALLGARELAVDKDGRWGHHP